MCIPYEEVCVTYEEFVCSYEEVCVSLQGGVPLSVSYEVCVLYEACVTFMWMHLYQGLTLVPVW